MKNSQQARNRGELLQPVRVSMENLQLVSYLIVQDWKLSAKIRNCTVMSAVTASFNVDNFPSTFNIQPFKRHMSRAKLALASVEKFYQMSGNRLWISSLFHFFFSRSFCPSLSNVWGQENRWGLEAGRGKGFIYTVRNQKYLFFWIKSHQGGATNFTYELTYL